MPANLPPQYFDAEKRYRLARTPQEKIQALEEMLRIMPKHKGTDRLQGELRRKISLLRKEACSKSSGGRRGDNYFVEKAGAGQVVMAGPPNSGKSSLMRALTNAKPEVADYPFTTRTPQAGIMVYQNVRIQLVDVPPVHPEMTEPWVYAILRNSDVIWIVLDLASDDLLQDLESVLEALDGASIKPVGEGDYQEDQDRLTKRALVVANKIDSPKGDEHLEILQEFYSGRFPILGVSAMRLEGLQGLVHSTFRSLGIIRAYTKVPGKAPDLEDPVILPAGSTVADFAEQIHKDFAQKLKFARIWGANKHDGQRVHLDFPLEDGDILELHI
ncbi:MAG: GTPase [Thermodesulfobacteriota bacterium]